MKFLCTAAAAAALVAGPSFGSAFAPPSSSSSSRCIRSSSSSCLGMNNLPFFAQEEKKSANANANDEAEALLGDLDAMSMEEEIELLVQKELSKTKRMSNLRNEKGVEYAPWMGISESDESKIRSLMRERTEARRKRQEEARDVSGNLFRDSQAQELSGTGLSYKIIGSGEVELQWATRTETNTKGFVVKRRAAKTNDYSIVASHRDYGPLASKGRGGGCTGTSTRRPNRGGGCIAYPRRTISATNRTFASASSRWRRRGSRRRRYSRGWGSACSRSRRSSPGWPWTR